MKARAVHWKMWRRRGAVLGLLAAIFWFYLWTVSQGLPLPVGTSQGMYPPLTDAFLAGQLSLPVVPHPQLLKLENTYDHPDDRPPYFHDASLYEGKYYVYFGVTPVVLLFLPFRVLGLGNLPESAAVAVFMFGSVLFSLLTLAFLRRTEFPTFGKLPYEIYFMLGLGGAIPYFLRRPAVYEVAIACGSCCLMVAIYCLVTLDSTGKLSRVRAALASLFLGLAVGARPHLLIASPLLVFGAWRVLRREKRWPSSGEAAALLLPILLVGLALGWYNYARFDSWTEFGRWYQLAGEPVRQLHFDVRRLPLFSYLYLLHAGEINLAFPYIHVKRPDLPDLGGVIVEPVTGLFYSTPVIFVLALLPLLGARRRDEDAVTQPARRSAHIWAWVFVALALAQLLFIASFPGATMRYLVDFSPLLLMAAAIVMMAIAVRLQDSWWRLPVRAAMVLVVGLSVLLNVGLGIRGYYNNLQVANPAAYDRLKSRGDRVADVIAPWISSTTLQLLSVTSPWIEQDQGVPSFWIGNQDASFELYVRDDGFVLFSTILSLHQDARDLGNVRLTIASERGETSTLVTPGTRAELVILPVQRGHNHFVLRLDLPPSAIERSRPRIVFLHGRGWRFSKTAPAREG